ncbi:2823_t:CDS:2, partial [Ambispora leptoticha]
AGHLYPVFAQRMRLTGRAPLSSFCTTNATYRQGTSIFSLNVHYQGWINPQFSRLLRLTGREP